MYLEADTICLPAGVERAEANASLQERLGVNEQNVSNVRLEADKIKRKLGKWLSRVGLSVRSLGARETRWKRERPDGRRFAFVVSHPSDKNKDVRWMGHPAKFHLFAGQRGLWRLLQSHSDFCAG